MLEIAEPAVNDLQAVPGSPAAEIVLLYEGNSESAEGRISGDGSAEDPSSYNQNIEGLVGERVLGMSQENRPSPLGGFKR